MVKHIAVGILLGLCLVGCAGFSYHYYGLDADSYEGSLLGPEPKDDLVFTVCTPTAAHKSPCVVMLEAEFFKMKQDMIDTATKLKKCESGQ